MHHPHIILTWCMLSREWALRATWMSYDVIPRDWATYMSCQGWAIWAIQQDHLIIHACFASCEVPGIGYIRNFIDYLRMFSGGELWAPDERGRDLSDVCKTTPQTATKGLHYPWFNRVGEEAFGFQSDLRSASGTRGPLIFRYFDALARFLFLTISHFVMYLGDSSPCAGKL